MMLLETVTPLPDWACTVPPPTEEPLFTKVHPSTVAGKEVWWKFRAPPPYVVEEVVVVTVFL